MPAIPRWHRLPACAPAPARCRGHQGFLVRPSLIEPNSGLFPPFLVPKLPLGNANICRSSHFGDLDDAIQPRLYEMSHSAWNRNNINSHSKEPLAKSTFARNCHSERSEESRIYKGLRSFTSFRMTKPTLLQEPQKVSNGRAEPWVRPVFAQGFAHQFRANTRFAPTKNIYV